MAVTVLIPTALRQYAQNRDTLQLDGGVVSDILSKLADEYPQLRHHLFDDQGALRSFVNVYVNDEDIRYLKQQQTPVQDGDRLMIVPAVAGGQDTTAVMQPASAADDIELSREEIERYSRHLLIPEVAMSGQKKLKQSRVVLVGAGGLGSPLAMYLAAAGVGTLGLVDYDVVDYTNLQRQVIHLTDDVGRSKLQSAKETIERINPHVNVEAHETALTSDNALRLLDAYDLVIDGTDNFATRYLVNDACVLLGKPNVYGSIFRFEGQATVFDPRRGPCYRCLYPVPPPPGLVPSCAEGGVLGILPGTVGLIQATEAVKLLLDIGSPLIGRLVLYNALDMTFREVRLRKNPDCPVCGDHPTVTQLIDYVEFCGVTSQVTLDREWEVTPGELQAELTNGHDVRLLDVREPHENEICKLPDSHLVPLGQLETRLHELERDWNIVAYCRSGTRSAQAVKFLREAGFGQARNLVRGILGWADEVDPSLPRY